MQINYKAKLLRSCKAMEFFRFIEGRPVCKQGKEVGDTEEVGKGQIGKGLGVLSGFHSG